MPRISPFLIRLRSKKQKRKHHLRFRDEWSISVCFIAISQSPGAKYLKYEFKQFETGQQSVFTHVRSSYSNSIGTKQGFYLRKRLNCERVEPRSHFKSRLSLIVRVNVVLNRTVVVDSDWRFDNLCGSHLQRWRWLPNIRNIRICMGKNYRFRNIWKWKDFNKKQLTLRKMCVMLC